MNDLVAPSDPDQDLLNAIRSTRSLPSPPTVAVRLIELAEDPDATLSALVDVLHGDPALTARVLRLANSPLYGPRQRAESLQQAVVMLGMDAVFAAALSLSVLSSRTSMAGSSHIVQRQWTRSVRAAAAAQILARRCGGVTPTDAFLGGLLQDIGVLVLLRVAPHIYDGLPKPYSHDDLVRLEREHVGIDHAHTASILLDSWQLPARIVDAVARSHDGGDIAHRLANVVALGALLADWLEGATGLLPAILGSAEQLLGLDERDVVASLEDLQNALPELSAVFDAAPPPPELLADMAADVLVVREIRRRIDPIQMQEELAGLTEVARQLVNASRLDAVTGLANRGHLDVVLDREFERARQSDADLAVLFIDLDDFKLVNERFGHQGGDAILRQAADLVSRSVRNFDTVGRYGGDEVVVILRGATGEQAEQVAGRLVNSFAEARFAAGDGLTHRQTITVGIGSLDLVTGATSAADLLRVADLALLDAKRRGKGTHSATRSA